MVGASFENMEQMIQDIKEFMKKSRYFYVTIMNSVQEGATYTDIVSINIASISDKINLELRDNRGKAVGAIIFTLGDYKLYRTEFNNLTYYVFEQKK
ncbi:hypothetical protein [Clostridium cylindrosporum]|uniref:Uncharacterized protein n=1 Tax=Clostridium cylindrosporum DSM 605 TaxID=1121307 RepID=A0A0J8D859_CLOCY|nr:hypothetical protein [Clostridium cylindrosporum]KMT22245.1 hypothetical protein CLCY_4c02180 [Clostridium cylindrosporum DSM 605]